jgi:hypothetical protein
MFSVRKCNRGAQDHDHRRVRRRIPRINGTAGSRTRRIDARPLALALWSARIYKHQPEIAFGAKQLPHSGLKCGGVIAIRGRCGCGNGDK